MKPTMMKANDLPRLFTIQSIYHLEVALTSRRVGANIHLSLGDYQDIVLSPEQRVSVPRIIDAGSI